MNSKLFLSTTVCQLVTQRFQGLHLVTVIKKKIQKGPGAKSYTVYEEGFLTYEEIRKYLVTYDDSEEAVNLYI